MTKNHGGERVYLAYIFLVTLREARKELKQDRDLEQELIQRK